MSENELRRLLAEKEAEADRVLALELTAACEKLKFQEALTERMRRVTDLYELGRLVLDEFARVFGSENALLALVTESQFLEVVASSTPAPPRHQIDLIEEAFVVGETLSVSAEDAENMSGGLGSADLPAGTPMIAVPLFRREGHPLGVFYVEGVLRADRADWLADFLLTISEALEDCLHYNHLEQLVTDALLAIATAHEERIPRQVGHFRRVEEVAVQLSRALGLTATQEKQVRLLALVHDLTPEQVMEAFNRLKRGSLTMQDWHHVVSDPFAGGIYASPLNVFQRVLYDLRHLHHRWDGKGNAPDVRGEAIPLAARVVAVAEAFEHLTGSRSHRTTLAIPGALAELQRYAGTIYDPKVMAVLASQYATVELQVRISPLPPVEELGQ